MHPITFFSDLWSDDPLTFWFLAFITAVWLTGIGIATVPLLIRTARIGTVARRAREILEETGQEGQPHAARRQLLQLLTNVPQLRSPALRYDRWWRGALLPRHAAAVGSRSLVDFVGENDLVAGWSRAIAGVLPGILVALGILGTFWGLVNGLPSVSHTSVVADAEGFRGFVSNITKSLSLAFYTSIFGIIGSVTFLLFDKTIGSVLESRLEKLAEIVSTCYPTITDDELGRLHFGLVEDGLSTLKNVSVDVAQSLANYMGPAISQAMHAELGPAVLSIQNAVERLIKFSTDQQGEAVRGLVDGFVTSMNESMGNQFDSLKQVISQTIDEQAKLGEGVRVFSVQLRSTAESQGELVERTTRLARTLGGSVESLERTAPALKEAAEGLGEMAESLADAAAALATSNEQLASRQQDLLEKMAEQQAALEKARQDVTDGWMAAVEKAKDSIHQITEAARQIGEGVGDQLSQALSAFDSVLAEVVKRFSGTLLQLDSTVKELPPAALATRDAVVGVKDQIQGLMEGVVSLERMISGPLVQFGKDTAAAAAHLHGVVETSQRTVRLGADATDRISDAVLELRASSTTFGKRVEDLHSAAAALNETARTMRLSEPRLGDRDAPSGVVS